MDFIQRARADGRPFFVQLSHYAVHSDIIYSSESYSETESLTPGTCHSNVGYAAMLLDLDRSIGRLLTFYANQNLMQNTFFSSSPRTTELSLGSLTPAGAYYA